MFGSSLSSGEGFRAYSCVSDTVHVGFTASHLLGEPWPHHETRRFTFHSLRSLTEVYGLIDRRRL